MMCAHGYKKSVHNAGSPLLPCSLHMLILCSVGVMGMAPFGEWEGLGQLQDMVEQR